MQMKYTLHYMHGYLEGAAEGLFLFPKDDPFEIDFAQGHFRSFDLVVRQFDTAGRRGSWNVPSFYS
jgi:hypothetical protein